MFPGLPSVLPHAKEHASVCLKQNNVLKSHLTMPERNNKNKPNQTCLLNVTLK